MNYIPQFGMIIQKRRSLSPEKRKEVEAERMYKEYKEQCKWGRKPKTLGQRGKPELLRA